MVIKHSLDQNLHLATTGLMPVQACINHLGIVEYQHVMRLEQVGKLNEMTVMKVSGSIQMKQAASVAISGRLLGNQGCRKVVVKLREFKGLGHDAIGLKCVL